jgi:radical SAM superfamily enzyme YgiQ (UPF0313 family)
VRVLLAQPPLSTAPEVSPPLGLCTLAAWLIQKGHEVSILDLDLEVKGAPDGPASHRQLLANAVRDFEPQVVGLTSMFNNSLQAERLARTIKECDESIVTVAGGSHFGALTRRALERIPELDYAIEGEGEEAFSALLDALAHGSAVADIPRLCHRVEGEARQNPSRGLLDLAEIPAVWPAVERCVDIGRYAATIPAGTARRTIYIEAGRGCPFACSFCGTAPFWERKYRVKPVATILDEVRFLHERYGYNGFMLVHDLLTVDRDFLDELSEAFRESRLPVEWMANHRTDIDLHGLLPKMKTAGCWAMFFGIESASARLQKVMRKGLKRDGVVSTITGLANLGIGSTCSFVIGFPDETPEELSATIAMGADLKLLGAGTVQFHRLRTWPPAPLSRVGLPARFDLDSLRIEYPFLDVPAEDAAAIEADPEFFAGYFAPHTTAGSFAQMAQVEMFFTYAVFIAPLTVAVMGRMSGAGLIQTFYNVLAIQGGISRQEVESEPGSAWPAWRAVRPRLEDWIAIHPALEDWQRELIQGALLYEENRLRFVNSGGVDRAGTIAHGKDWAAFPSTVDISALFDRMETGEPLSGDLAGDWAVVFVDEGAGRFRAYTVEPDRLPELSRRPSLTATLTATATVPAAVA